jgi:hypothetical protein
VRVGVAVVEVAAMRFIPSIGFPVCHGRWDRAPLPPSDPPPHLSLSLRSRGVGEGGYRDAVEVKEREDVAATRRGGEEGG